MAPYIISVNNQTNSKQSYAIFSAPPTIKRNGDDTAVHIVTRIITSVRGVASPSGLASFMLSKQLYATCGVYDVETDPSPHNHYRKRIGTGIEVVDQRAVSLGTKNKDGSAVNGTTLRIECSGGTPAFTEDILASSGALDCFAVVTGNDFSSKEAKANQYVVGYSSSMRQNIGPYATFVPEPGQEYQIAPSKVFYVVVGQFNPYDLTSQPLSDVGTIASGICKVDFSILQTDQVTLVHTDRGELIRQVETAPKSPESSKVGEMPVLDTPGHDGIAGSGVAAANGSQE